jgi:hypothetical protein
VVEWRRWRTLQSLAEWERRRAEAGYLPRTVEGCIAVLDVALWITDAFAEDIRALA